MQWKLHFDFIGACMCACVRWLHLCVCVRNSCSFSPPFAFIFSIPFRVHFIFVASKLCTATQTSSYYLAANEYVIHSASSFLCFVGLCCLSANTPYLYICQFIRLFLYFDRIEIVAKAAPSVRVCVCTHVHAHMLNIFIYYRFYIRFYNILSLCECAHKRSFFGGWWR